MCHDFLSSHCHTKILTVKFTLVAVSHTRDQKENRGSSLANPIIFCLWIHDADKKLVIAKQQEAFNQSSGIHANNNTHHVAVLDFFTASS